MHEIDLMLKLQLEGKHTEARVLSDKLEEIGPKKILDPQGKNTVDIWLRHCFNRGWFLLQEGKYQEGCQLLENGRFLSVYGSPPLKTDAPIYNPKEHDIKGKSLIISLEGGYGDEIIHARFATSFKNLGASKVYLAAAPEVCDIFSRIEGVDGVILRNQVHTVQHDFWLPGFSAGWLAGHTFEDLPGKPYLTPLTDSIKTWSEIIKSDKIKVGIRWAGNPKFEHQQFRRFPEAFITNLSKYEELEIYSLQRDHNTIQLPDGITDLQHLLISWEDTLAAIANLDIVITSCTSVAHLAAAMGKETWVIVPVLPYHTWTYKSPDSSTSPYYESVTLFRQTEKGKWNDTFQKLYSSLETKFNLKHIDMTNEDKVTKRINLGCGMQKIEGFVNVDINPIYEPDVVVDLNKFPWPFADNEFDHVVAKDIIEHLGDTGADFIKVMQELYRISNNGAIWEVQAPHWNCDIAKDDPTHTRVLTPNTFGLFNKKLTIERLNNGQVSTSTLAFDADVDIEVCDMQFQYTPLWEQRVRKKEITPEELNYALNYMNNVALTTMFLIQVHKPGRNDFEEYEKIVKETLKLPYQVLKQANS